MTTTTSRTTRAGWWLKHQRDLAVFHVEHWLADHDLITPRRPPGSTWDVQQYADAYHAYVFGDYANTDDDPVYVRRARVLATAERRISQRQAQLARRRIDGPGRLRIAAMLFAFPAAIAVTGLIVHIAGGSL